VELSAGEKLRSISARGTVDCRLKFPESFWFPRVYGKIVGDLQSRFANKGATVFESLASQERIDLAKTTMTKVRDHFLYLRASCQQLIRCVLANALFANTKILCC
jgi:hypothetical protein